MNWFAQVPRDLRHNLIWRRKLIKACLEDTALQKDVIAVCSEDPVFWINSFVWQHNPNSIGKGSLAIGPFITWEFQDEVIWELGNAIDERYDVVIEKSRELGASWICLLVFDHRFLFREWQKFLAISRNQEAVDRPGDSDSLFWKLDHVHKHLPDWMTAGRIKRRRNLFVNPLLHSRITGQATTEAAGVGGRATAMFIDEFSRIKEDREVLQGTSDTTGCRIFNGTHMGTETGFYQLCDPNSQMGRSIKKIVIHWSQHPDKRKGLYRSRLLDGRPDIIDTSYEFPPDYDFMTDDSPIGGPFPGLRSPWYDKQCERRPDPRAIAMDLDINPTGTVSQYFHPMTIRDLTLSYCVEPFWVGDVAYDLDTGAYKGLVESEAGPLKLWINPSSDHRIPFDSYCAGGDISQGVGVTPSCLSFGSATTGHKLAEYVNANIRPDELAVVAVALCWLFRDQNGQGAFFCWEARGPGLGFGKTVVNLGYGNIYIRSVRTNHKGFFKDDPTIPGWSPNPKSKMELLQAYREALYRRQFINRSEAAMNETLLFQYAKDTVEHPGERSKSDPSGATVNHGDRVIADALLWKMMHLRSPGVGEVKKEAKAISVMTRAGRDKFMEEQRQRASRWI